MTNYLKIFLPVASSTFLLCVRFFIESRKTQNLSANTNLLHLLKEELSVEYIPKWSKAFGVALLLIQKIVIRHALIALALWAALWTVQNSPPFVDQPMLAYSIIFSAIVFLLPSIVAGSSTMPLVDYIASIGILSIVVSIAYLGFKWCGVLGIIGVSFGCGAFVFLCGQWPTPYMGGDTAFRWFYRSR